MKNLKDQIQSAVDIFKSGDYSKAEKVSKKLVNENPKVAYLYNLLGLILTAQMKREEAIEFYEKGLKIDPKFALIYNNLGLVYFSQNTTSSIKKAENSYKKSIALNDKIAEPYNNLGNLYKAINKYKEAEVFYKKSISVGVKLPQSHYNLGILYKSIGKFEECKKCFQESIRLHPEFYEAHRAFSQIHKYKVKDNHIDVMKELYDKDNIDTPGKISLTFALGKAFDDTKNFENAFKYYNMGNKLRRNHIEFSLERENEEFSNIKRTFNKNFFNKYQNIGNDDPTAIFILGMPRSGTTLVEQIISSHPKVYGGDELNFFNAAIKNLFYKRGNFSVECINQKIDEKLKKLGQEYINKIKEISGKSEKVTDKLPINFKWIGFIKLALPNSKIIHCTRNAKDICLSIYKNYFTNAEFNYAYDFEELVNFYNLYEDLMKFWKNNLPGFITEIKYENLIKGPAKEIPKLIKNCNLSWDKSCIKFYNNKRAIKTASNTQARKKIYRNSMDSWKNYDKYLKENFTKLKY